MSDEKIIVLTGPPVLQSGGGGGAVSSVFGRTGDVTAQPGDYSIEQIANVPYSLTTELVTFDRDVQIPQNSLLVGDAIKMSDLAQSLGYSTAFNGKEYVILGYEVTENESKRPVIKSFSEPSSFDLQPLTDTTESFQGLISFNITSVQQVIGKTYRLNVLSDTDVSVKLFRLAENGGQDTMIVDETVLAAETNLSGFDFDLSPIVDFEDAKVYRLEIDNGTGNGQIQGTLLTGPNPYSVSSLDVSPNFVPYIRRQLGWVYENKEIALEDDTKVSTDPNNAAIQGNDGRIFVPQINQGAESTVFFTAEEVTTTEGTFYKTLINERGSVADTPSPNEVLLNDNESGAFPVEFLGEINPVDQLILQGSYAAFPIIEIANNNSNIRIKIEAYICDGDGVPFDCGGEVGTLGVETLLIADSGIIDVIAGNPININCQGALDFSVTPNSPTMFNAGQRFRYVVVAEKVGTGGNTQTFTLFSGSDYNSFFKIPSTSATIVKRSQDFIPFFSVGPVTAPEVLKTQAGFTIPTGKYFGGNVKAFLKGVKFACGVITAGSAATFSVQIRYRDKGLSFPHTPGGANSTLLKEVELYSTASSLAAVYNEGNEVTFDPVELIPDKVYFVDVSSITGFSITNLDVDLLVESQPNSTQFLF